MVPTWFLLYIFEYIKIYLDDTFHCFLGGLRTEEKAICNLRNNVQFHEIQRDPAFKEVHVMKTRY